VPKQAQRGWRARPKAVALLLAAVLGTLGSLGVGGRGLIRLRSPGERARRQMLSAGVPAGLMAVNVTAAYAQGYCARLGGAHLLAEQAWQDAPICQLPSSGGNTSIQANCLLSCLSCSAARGCAVKYCGRLSQRLLATTGCSGGCRLAESLMGVGRRGAREVGNAVDDRGRTPARRRSACPRWP
jgi:hypothetical protein